MVFLNSTATLLPQFSCASELAFFSRDHSGVAQPSSVRRLPCCLSYVSRNFRAWSLNTKKFTDGQINLAASDDSESESESSFDDDDGEETDEEGDMLLPFKKMKEWLRNKPSGFGEGRVYDTAVEDKLLDEIAQSRRAQAINLAKLKSSRKQENYATNQISKDDERPSGGIRVRLSNLPKKKNIHRDLNLAFKDARGIISIVPAVCGNKKTKDPICKGLAFVYFNSQENADRFIKQFSSQVFGFGKIQKQIKFQIMKSQSAGTSYDEAAETSYSENIEYTFVSAMESLEDGDEEIDDAFDTNVIDVESIEVTDAEIEVSRQTRNQTANGSNPGKDKRKKHSLTRNGVQERRKVKLDIPASAARLKIREKAMLNGVFTKYASPSACPESKG